MNRGSRSDRVSASSRHPYIPNAVGPNQFYLDGRSAVLHRPASPAGGRPWVMYAPRLSESAPDETFYLTALAAAGIHVAAVNVGESYGAPYGRAIFQRLYEEMRFIGLKATCLVMVRSRGGLMGYNWAIEHPTLVTAIAGIYPVGDMASYPGLASVDLHRAYAMTQAELTAVYPQHNPIGRLAGLAAAGVKIYHVHGDADAVVPLAANSQVVKTQYDGLSGTMTLEIIAGGGHDLNVAYFENTAFRDFMLANV